MSIGTSWGPCPGCGAWGGAAALCPECGEARTADRVPLTQAAADGRWIAAAGGTPAEVRAALDALSLPSPDARARVAAAAALLDGVAGDQVRLHLDLRRPEAGLRVHSVRSGHFQHTRYLLPWLVLRVGERELRITRYAHTKLQRRFDAGQMVSQGARGELDELAATGPEGARRQPLPRLDALRGLALTLDPAAPPPRPLPATAPAAGVVQRLAWTQGAVASVVLCGIAPWLIGLLAGLPARAPVDAGLLADLAGHPRPALVAELLDGPASRAQSVAREACVAADAWQRRHGLLLAARCLPLAERLRTLAWSAQQDAVLEVRLLAVDLLGTCGDAGATQLVRLHEDPATPLAVRAQAHRRLLDLDDPRALELARAGLERAREPELDPTWARALVRASADDLQRWTAHPDPHVRAAARWALARRASR